MSAEQRRMGDWSLHQVMGAWMLTVIDSCSPSLNHWQLSRYRWETDFMGNGYWRFHDEDTYWKNHDRPQRYDDHEWKSGLLPKSPPPPVVTRLTERSKRKPPPDPPGAEAVLKEGE